MKSTKKTRKSCSALSQPLQELLNVENSIREGKIDNVKKIESFISSADQISLKEVFDSLNNPLRQTTLIILACKHNQLKILEYVLNIDNQILSLLTKLHNDKSSSILCPLAEDNSHHNAFYYAIRSGNVELLESLIFKWPGNYFNDHPDELEEILSRAFEELRLKNVSLSAKVEVFVEEQLLTLRFYSKNSKQQSPFEVINNIKERAKLIFENIEHLLLNYSNNEEVDEEFLYRAKFIAQNMHILKRKIKLTHHRLPWEEIEFCLVVFICTFTKIEEHTLYIRVLLGKKKILDYLKLFSEKLKNELSYIEEIQKIKLADAPSLTREEVVANVVSDCPQLAQLYEDHNTLRDMHSLKIINNCIQLTSKVNAKEREGRLIIVRGLQVIGEHMKNTLDSPKLSSNTIELLLLSLPKKMRKIITSLRDALSHGNTLSKRAEIEENKDENFFVGILNGIQTIGSVIDNILLNIKIKMLNLLCQKFLSAKNVNDLLEIVRLCDNIDIFTLMANDFISSEGREIAIETLVKALSESIPNQTNWETNIFNQINAMLKSKKDKRFNYQIVFSLIVSLKNMSSFNKTDHNTLRVLKFAVNQPLKNLNSNIVSVELNQIIDLLMRLFKLVRSRLNSSELNEVRRLLLYICRLCSDGELKRIEEFQEKLQEKEKKSEYGKKNVLLTKKTIQNQLSQKISELKAVLNKNMINRELGYNYSSYRSNKKLQAIVEMLVLDVLSILELSNPRCFENNIIFFDDNSPSLTGKCLRNHLSHKNILVGTLVFDATTTVALNASKLTTENITECTRKIGMSIYDENLERLRARHEQAVRTINSQKRLFDAFITGNLMDVEKCLNDGADINAKNINGWTVAHFAAQGTSKEVMNFILSQNLSLNQENLEGETPLYIAVLHGRTEIVKYLLDEVKLNANVTNLFKSSSLHIAAAKGYTDIVKILLKRKADTKKEDAKGFLPIHYAVENNHKNTVEILLSEGENAHNSEIKGGFTPLHVAAEAGAFELVKLLLQKGSDVNGVNDNGTIPLHLAALNGYLEVVETLVSNGSKVNLRDFNGCIPLHYAVERDHKEIACLLLKHGSNVNAVDKDYFIAPLHTAVKEGYTEMVRILLRNKADVDAFTVEGQAPLHFASDNGYLEIVKILMEYNAKANATDNFLRTPLHFASNSGHFDVIEFLLTNNADPNAYDFMNYTPLHRAALNGYGSIVELLIKNKAKVNVQDTLNNSPLHDAASNGKTDVIRLLIANKAQVDVKNLMKCTPLFNAAFFGHKEPVACLIENGAYVNVRSSADTTPLDAAIQSGCADVVKLLVDHKAVVNVMNARSTPLHKAIDVGNVEICKILIENGADANLCANGVLPLCEAVKNDNKALVEVLLENGARVNGESGNEPLELAVRKGYSDIVDVLLRNKADIFTKRQGNLTLLHIAAEQGHKKILNALITRGAKINATTDTGMTALHFAAINGSEEIITILLAKGARVDSTSLKGTPLHLLASLHDSSKAFELFLNHGADVTIENDKGRTPLELALENNHPEAVKSLISKIYLKDNAKLLLSAAVSGNLELVKLLVCKGCDIHTRNSSGLKAIHLAAANGFKEIVAFFIRKGFSVNETCVDGKTLLHFSASNLDTSLYLLSQGADVNAQDANGASPLHVAAQCDNMDTVKAFLINGAFYAIADKNNKKPLDVATGEDVLKLLTSTSNLFKAIKKNCFADVESCINDGAFLSARNKNDLMPLHQAVWRRHNDIVEILLKNNADANGSIKGGCRPLHYAVKSSDLEITKTLLSYGAIYNCTTDSQETPINFAKQKAVVELLTLIDDSFKCIESGTGSCKFLRDLKKIKDIDTIKAIMNARNLENRTLIDAGILTGFPKINDLTDIMQEDVPQTLNLVNKLCCRAQYNEALTLLDILLKKRVEILGINSPATWSFQKIIAKIYYRQHNFKKASNIIMEIYQNQLDLLGAIDEKVLKTRSFLALILHRLGKQTEALNIYQEVYVNQLKLHNPTHSNVLDTELHMGLVLQALGRHEEALALNYEVFGKMKQVLGPYDPSTFSAQNNIGLVLCSLKKYDESLKIFREVYVLRTRVLGPNHPDTLRTLHNMITVLQNQGKHSEVIKAYEDLYNKQKSALGADHLDTLNTQTNLGLVFFQQGKSLSALQHLKGAFEQRKAKLGKDHPDVLRIQILIEEISAVLKISGREHLCSLSSDFLTKMNINASTGDEKEVERFINIGVDVNESDANGWSPLYYAVSNGHLGVVKMLLSNEANAFQISNSGNTPLHIAVSKGYNNIAEELIQQVELKKLNEFVNAQTTGSGSTSLHVASEKGFLEIVITLLKNGAAYNIENKLGKTPLQVCKNKSITEFLSGIDDLFKYASMGNENVLVNQIRAMNNDRFFATMNARTRQGRTLVQTAIFNKNKNIASQLLRLLKDREQ